MPLVRVEVRNEYGLGMPELYTETNLEDPKAVLDGVAVAGLVGILRQLGDLAEFAAEVFHGLQEEVLITSSRSHRLVERVHNIEAALPPLEKAILAQRSHLHFAYTAGSHWHTRLKTEQNHFIYSDLPRCIMDSYEDCRDPPRLHRLDKFDAGGPGSCFKRYSDPTYFKRTSVGSYGAHLQSVPRAKKARRNKKKRSSSRYKEVTRDVPPFKHSGRMDMPSPYFNGKTFAAQDVPTVDVAPKSGMEPEMENHLTSFDSRTGSGYIECIFRPSFSTLSEENEPKELSDSKVQHNSYLDSPSLDEVRGVPDDNVQNSYSEEHGGPRSSYVTWDEKLEIMETGRPNDTTEISCAVDMPDTEEKEELNCRVDEIEFDVHDERLPTSVIVGGQHDEIESETDYYMDALNTIESESETDVDCHTKRELQQDSSLNRNDVEEGNHRGGDSDDISINLEPHVPEYTLSSKAMSFPSPKSISPESHVEEYSFSNNGTSEGGTGLDQFENNGQVIPPQTAGVSSISSTSSDIIKPETGEVLGRHVETVVSNGLLSSSAESNSQPLPSEPTLTTNESPKAHSLTPGVQTTLTHPVMFWTNGGLLGLEPSKPPDFGLSTPSGTDSVAKSKDSLIEHSNKKCPNKDDGHVAIADMMSNNPKSDPSSSFPGNNTSDHAHELDANTSSTTKPGADRPITKDEPAQENGISSSRIFEFSNRLLVNGFRRQISLVGDEKLASSVRSDVPEKTIMHKGYQTVVGRTFREQFGSGSPLMSPSSSPPLEHMRISFQPIDGFETSKLRLKFPDGSNCHESSGDMFPSFQLVPEPAISLHDSNSDSDDDTFCRSSPYASDDCCSHHSESDSEQWESGDSPRSKDHEPDEVFGRLSSAESVSSSLVNGIRFQQGFCDPGNSGLPNTFAKDGLEPSHSGRILDAPNFDSMNPSLNPVVSESDGKDFLESCFPKEPTPPPPPLPPLEWRGIKPHPDVGIEKEDALSEALTYTLDLTLPEPTVPQQPKPAPIKQDAFVERVDHAPKGKQPDWQKLTMQNDANHTTNGKVIEEKDDFLQQIRTKSFNLRRTTTARPTFTPGGPTNGKVTAILEKANAIRQAVGSDDGDDDNWSDT